MPAPFLIVAGLSSRMMAESAAQAGLRVAALDLFGDADTRHVAACWEPIGVASAPNPLTIDGERLLAGLRRLRGSPQLLGWVAGSGFEAHPELLEAGHALVPLLGNHAATVHAVKAPGPFFRLLSALGIPHPQTSLTPPPDPASWLCKRTGGTGGWHIRPASTAVRAGPPDADCYFQRQCAGVPMSALFLAHRGGVELLGTSRQRMAAARDRPYLFEGALGPMALPAGLVARLHEIVHCIARETGLVGLNSIDFLVNAPDLTPDLSVLEINPRPSASMALYAHRYPLGLMHAHLQACQGLVPAPPGGPPGGVRGFRLVFAQRPAQVNAMLTAALLRTGWCHDIPVPGTHVAVGEPLCTVSAAAATAHAAYAVEAALRQRCEQIQSLLKDRHDESNCNPDFGRSAHADHAGLAAERQLT